MVSLCPTSESSVNPTPEVSVSDAIAPDLSPKEAQRVFNVLKTNHDDLNEIYRCKYQKQAEFRNYALQLCEGKAYKHVINKEKDRPFATVAELAEDAFNMAPRTMDEILEAARVERKIRGFRVEFDNSVHVYGRDQTPTTYCLCILGRSVDGSSPDNLARVYFYAKEHCHNRKEGWKGKAYPTGDDIKKAAGILGLLKIRGNNIENNEFRVKSYEKAMSDGDVEALQYYWKELQQRLTELEPQDEWQDGPTATEDAMPLWEPAAPVAPRQPDVPAQAVAGIAVGQSWVGRWNSMRYRVVKPTPDGWTITDGLNESDMPLSWFDQAQRIS